MIEIDNLLSEISLKLNSPKIIELLSLKTKESLVEAYKIIRDSSYFDTAPLRHKQYIWLLTIKNYLRISFENPNLKYFYQINNQCYNHFGQYGLKEHFLYLYNDENKCWYST